VPPTMRTIREAVYVKLGGSFITVKDKPVTLRREALDYVIEIIKRVYGRVDIILGNGGGSFAHYTVKKYCGENPQLCIARCHQSTRLLNRLLVDYLVAHDIPATSVQTSSIISADSNELFKVFPDPLLNLLQIGVIPVVYGECIPYGENHIVVSTERVFELLAKYIRPSRIILLTDVEGVYTCNPSKCSDPELITRINSDNVNKVLEILSEDKARDATGGMYGKVESMVNLSRSLGVKVIVLSGFNTSEVVKAILSGEASRATIIEPP